MNTAVLGISSSLKKRTIAGLAWVATVLSPLVGQAHQSDAPHDHTSGEITYDFERHASPQRWAFELRFAPYLPRVDDEFDGATPYQDAFGDADEGKKGSAFSPGAQLDYQVLRIPYFGTLGPGLGIHWFRKGGIAEFEDGTSGSAHTNSLWILPMYGVAVLRVDVLARQFHVPLVPYAKAGFAWALWESLDAGKVSRIETAEGTDKARGLETGYQLQAGVMFHLNPLAPQAAVNMDASAGVNNAYLFGELWYSDINSFGSGMQVGTRTWVAGLAIEF